MGVKGTKNNLENMAYIPYNKTKEECKWGNLL